MTNTPRVQRPSTTGTSGAGRNQAPRTYRSQAGDSWRSLAQRFLGDAGRWRELADANAGVLGRSGTLKAGMNLSIPQGRPVASTARTDVPTPPPPADEPTVPTTRPPSARQVKAAETKLKRAGFKVGKVDGKLTAATTRALTQFQEAVGIPATGQIDPATREKLASVSQRIKREKNTRLARGQAGKRVLDAERRLRRLGYDAGKVDGVFDAQTGKATRAFRADQKELKNGSETLSSEARKVLKKESGALGHMPYRARVKPSAERRKLDARTAEAAEREHRDGTTGIGVGSKGAAVKYVQKHLKAAGFDPKRADGTFDERTEGALRAYQRGAGLEETGRVDARTWRSLRGATMEAKDATSPAQSIGERSGAVKRTEKLLKDLGLNPGKVDGLYTEATQRALDSFRRREKLKGKGDGVGPNTMRRIVKEWKKTRGVTASQLRRVMPGLSGSLASKYVGPLNKAMREFGITNEKRREAFLAQVGHESVSLRYFEEIASGEAYEGRTDLGNVRPGDGVRYKGRGPIQLTGRANYRTAGRALGLPLERKPWIASRPSVGFRIAGWFWKTRGLNGLADRGAFHEITQRINGGYNGLEDRLNRWARAKRIIK